MAVFMGAFILGTAAGSRVSRWIFGNPLAVFLGLISYSIYLWHFPILLWTMKLLDVWKIDGDRVWWLAGLAIPSTIVVAAMSYWWIERPLMLRSTPLKMRQDAVPPRTTD